MHLPQLLEQFEPETDPARRHWQVHLAAAWSMLPAAPVPVLVDWAIRLAGRGTEADRRLVEAVALDMLLAQEGEDA